MGGIKIDCNLQRKRLLGVNNIYTKFKYGLNSGLELIESNDDNIYKTTWGYYTVLAFKNKGRYKLDFEFTDKDDKATTLFLYKVSTKPFTGLFDDIKLDTKTIINSDKDENITSVNFDFQKDECFYLDAPVFYPVSTSYSVYKQHNVTVTMTKLIN